MGRQIHQRDGRSLICRHPRARRGVFAQRIVELNDALIEKFDQHFAGHQLAQGGDADHRIELRVLIIARARFAEAAKYALVTIDNHQRHTGRAAAVVDMVSVTVDNIGGEFRVDARLRGLRRCQRRRAQRSKNEQTTFQRGHPSW